MSKLIIVESPGKINTIRKYAGNDYCVKASIGHIKDLPKKELGIDVKNNFEPEFVVNEDKRDVVSDLKKTAKDADEIFLATDPDREGECIAQHLADELKISGKCRITFNEITKNAIQEALKHPREINKNKVAAQTTRRILDRLVGYSLSPILWRKVAPKTSAGRVQSAALLLIANKEREIRRFKSKDFWTIEALLKVDGHTISTQVVDNTGKIKEFESEKEALENLEEIKKNEIKFIDQITKTASRSPYPPFTTSTLQQACASFLGLSADQTMKLAQKLYEGTTVQGHGEVALITYMRTDSTRSAPEAITSARDHISNSFDKKYLPSTPRTYEDKKGKHQQDAHEAIRPTHLDIGPSCIHNQEYVKMYDLVWRRFVASQMSDAQLEQTRLRFQAGKTLLEAKGNRIVFDGFLSVYTMKIEEQTLPKLSKPKSISADKTENIKHSTQPPKRYSEAQLIKTLEKEGIGRPSTYATITKNIVDRGYVKKEKGSFSLTEIGLLVNDHLQKNFPDVINLKFTSEMEDHLDKIEEGENWVCVVSSFYESLQKNIKEANKSPKTFIKTNITCQKCSHTMVVKYGQNGRFLACEDYPQCKTTQDLSENCDILNSIDSYLTTGVHLDAVTVPVSDPCPKCGAMLRKRSSKFGQFWGCSGYPECKYILSIQDPIIPCPECGKGQIVEKGKTGKKFYACNAYPDCKKIFPYKPIDEKCDCKEHLVTYKKKSVCVNRNCNKFVETRPKNFKKGGKKSGTTDQE